MATNTITDSTSVWDGQQAQEFYSAALLTGDSKSKAQVMPNVKFKRTIPNMTVSNLLQASDCDYSSQGTITVGEKSIEVCTIKINKTICKEDFYDMWLSEQMRAGNNNENLPNTFEEYLKYKVGEFISKETEEGVWQWDTAGSPVDLCDGWLKGFAADGDVVDVVGTTLTVANIITELDKVYAAITDVMHANPDMTIKVSPTAARLFKQKIAQTSVESYITKDVPMSLYGMPIEVVNGLPTNDIVVCDWKNLWFATDLMDDFQSLKFIDTAETLGDKNIRIVGGFKFGTGHAVGAEIVYYT